MRRWDGGIEFSDLRGHWTVVGTTRPSALESAWREHIVAGGDLGSRVVEWCRDPGTWPDMLALYDELGGNRSCSPPTMADAEEFIIPFLRCAFERGWALAAFTPWGLDPRKPGAKEEEVFGGKHAPSEPPPRSEAQRTIRRISEKSFLDVTLVDSKGRPFSGRKFKIQLPSGATERGTLVADGRIFRGNIDPGTARLTLVSEAASAIDATAHDESTVPVDSGFPSPVSNSTAAWIAFQLVDQGGAPVANMTIEVQLADGTTQSLTSDAAGFVKLEDVPPGPCQVSVPNLDSKLWSVG